MTKPSPGFDSASAEGDNDGWTINFVFEDGACPVHINMAKIANWAGAAATEEEVRAVRTEHAAQLDSIAIHADGREEELETLGGRDEGHTAGRSRPFRREDGR